MSVHKLDLPPVVPTMVLFFSIDGPPGFGVIPVTKGTLEHAVRDAHYPRPGQVLDADQLADVGEAAQALRASGTLAFEDGWLRLKRADAIAAKYTALRDALITAFGDKAPGILALAQDAPEAPR